MALPSPHSFREFYVPFDSESSARALGQDQGGYARVPRTQPPETLVWDITFRCNLKCTHCYNAEKYGYGQPDYGRGFTNLSLAECRDVVNWAREAGLIHIHLLGGEPLSRPDLPEIIRYATQEGLAVTLTSNGTLVTEKLANRLIDSGLEQISISLDGGTAETNDSIRGSGTFARIIHGLTTLQSVRTARGIDPIEVGISFTLTRPNLMELPEALEIGREKNVDVIVFQDLFDLGVSDKRPDLLYSNDEEIDGLENLASYILDRHLEGASPVLQIDISYPVYRYLERKFRAGLVTPKRLPVCPAGTNLIYMDSGGFIYPCVVADKGHKGIYFRDSGARLASSRNVRSRPAVTEGFATFFDARENLSFPRAPCPTCDYRPECLPCPMLVTFEQARGFSICKAVFRRERAFEWPILHGKVQLSSGVVVSDGPAGMQLELLRGGKPPFQVRGSGRMIVEGIRAAGGTVAVTDLVDTVSRRYPSVKRRRIVRDVIDFVWHMHLVGVASLALMTPPNPEEFMLEDRSESYPLIQLH